MFNINFTLKVKCSNPGMKLQQQKHYSTWIHNIPNTHNSKLVGHSHLKTHFFCEISLKTLVKLTE